MASRDLRTLVELVAHLRSPQGCPWDREQTHRTLTGLLIEEAYEVVSAIEVDDPQALMDELGDLLLHVAFHVQIAQEAGEFDLAGVMEAVHEKVIRRHPHVFGEHRTQEMAEIKANWERLKREEGTHQDREMKRWSALPALVEARKALDRAANLGLPLEVALDDLDEQFAALADWVREADVEALGALLLQIVAWAREAGLEPEFCLKGATARLAERLEDHLNRVDHE
jgi:tetrapyrrole methylase family protein/MazG family protein